MMPIVDLHCDLLHYLAEREGAHPEAGEAIGCALPHLRAGEVRLQVMALYSTDQGNPDALQRQADWFHRLYREWPDTVTRVTNAGELQAVFDRGRTGVAAALENLSGVCPEGEPLAQGIRRFDRIAKELGPLAYVSLTHGRENRFGGGNASTKGLKEDGRHFLNHIDRKRIPLDLSHASDRLARDALDHMDRQGLEIPVLAGHSNFRAVWDRPRNLPDDLARAVIERGGLIGLNLVRAILHDEEPGALFRHIAHALALEGTENLCFGADFFCEAQHPDPARAPFFFPDHANAGKYPALVAEIAKRFGAHVSEALAFQNGLRFFQRWWDGA